jgi:hypothetical protein
VSGPGLLVDRQGFYEFLGQARGQTDAEFTAMFEDLLLAEQSASGCGQTGLSSADQIPAVWLRIPTQYSATIR